VRPPDAAGAVVGNGSAEGPLPWVGPDAVGPGTDGDGVGWDGWPASSLQPVMIAPIARRKPHVRAHVTAVQATPE
jgi:hypothetical protein